MYKLIATDMDGTLLDDNKNIPSKNLEAIKEALNNDKKVVLATGRPLNGIKKYINQLHLDNEKNFSVVFNGAVVQNNKNGEILSKKILTHEDVLFLKKLSEHFNVHMHLLTIDECLSEDIGEYTKLESVWNDIPLKVVDYNNLDKDVEVIKVLFADDPKLISEIIPKIDKKLFEKYTIVQSAPFFLEFLNKDANKGVGVEILSKRLNIKNDEVICIGDAGNDIHMIKFAGLGVAMENAFDEVKKIANYTTLTNENGGVAHVINKFMLNK